MSKRALRRGPQEWVVCIPAWGKRCVDVLLDYTLPATLRAFEFAGLTPILFIYTDDVKRIQAALPRGANYIFRDLPGPDRSFGTLSNCHRDAMSAYNRRSKVILLTADMIMSAETIATCDEQISKLGKHIVCCVALRALETESPPVGATGRDLLKWAWENKHPMTRECTWPDGRSYDIWRMYFEKGGEVAARAFLPHPLAVVPHGRKVAFNPTIDVNLTSNFSRAFTHVITTPEEGAVVELSPADKEFVMTTTMIDRYKAGMGLPGCPPLVACTNARHKMFFSKRVIIKGNGSDCGDGEVVRRVLG